MDVVPTVSPKSAKRESIFGLAASLSIGRRRVATAAAALLAVGVGYHVVFGANGLTAFEQKRQETQHLNQRMQDLQRENDRLKDHVQRLQTDPNAIEQQAREGLRYTRPGEVIYTLPGK
jgi:cell division protein FtsB